METFAKRILMFVAAVLMIGYVGYHIFMANYSPVTVSSAERCVEYETLDTQGLVVRNESLIPHSGQAGYVYYIAQNGSRVSKNGTIADLYASEQQAADHQRLQQLDQKIEELESIQEQGQSNRVNLDIITTQLGKVQSELIGEMNASHFSRIDELSDQLLALMNKQQITIGKDVDFTAQIQSLKAERERLNASNTAPSGSISSPVAGYFVNSVDGMESVVNVDDILSITPAEFETAVKSEPVADNRAYIGKVVGSYEWYLTCVVPAEDMAHLSLGTALNIRLPFVSNDLIPVVVAAANRDRDGNVAVVFRCDYMSASLSNIRVEQVQILVEEHVGLRVPDEAIHFNERHEAGVYIKKGNVIHFRRIQVIYHSESGRYSVCDINRENDDQYLQMYDDIVVEGKDLYDGKII